MRLLRRIYELSACPGLVRIWVSSQSRLQTALNTLQLSRDNLVEARERIVSADIAQVSAVLTRAQVLQQTGAAVLAQANEQPRLAVSLLQDS